MFIRLFFLSALTTCLGCATAQAQALKAPPGLFKNLNDKTVGDAMIINGKQLFIDDYIHVLQWNDNPDCHLVQARPIKLRFHLNNAKLYSFTPRIRHKHYVPSYD